LGRETRMAVRKREKGLAEEVRGVEGSIGR